MFIDIFSVILGMNISEKIKEIREAKRFTQRELAENLSMTIGNYQKIEAGSVSITFDRLQQIADVFKMSVVEIIEYPNIGKNNDASTIPKKSLREFSNILHSTERILASLLFFFSLLKEKNIDYEDLYKIAIKDYNKQLLDIADSFSEYSKKRASHIPKERIVTQEIDIDEMDEDSNIIDLINLERNKIRMVEKKYFYDIAELLFGQEIADIIYRDTSNNLNKEPKKKDN